MNVKAKKIATYATITMLGATIILLAVKNSLIKYIVESKIEYADQKFQLTTKYDHIGNAGLLGVSIDGLTIVPHDQDTLFSADHMEVRINPWKLLLMSVSVRSVKTNNIELRFVKNDSISNFDFLYKTEIDSDSTNFNFDRNYANDANKLLGFFFDLLPSRAEIFNTKILYRNNTQNLFIDIPNLTVKNNQFSSEINIEENNIKNSWVFRGDLVYGDRKIDGVLYATDSAKIVLPFIKYKWGAEVSFDTLAFDVTGSRSSGMTIINGSAQINGLSVYHKRISPENITLDQGKVSFKFNIGKNYAELDSSTVVNFNKLNFSPYLRIERESDWRITASLNKNDFEADDLFSSLPKGLFYNMEGIKTSGRLSYHFLFDVDMAEIDSLKFESNLISENFKIEKYGNTDLRLMNGAFTYTAYEQGVAVKSFEIGEGNPNFRPINAISPILQMAVMQSEDGAFYYHNGFLIDAMRSALVEDIKKRKFARGGSTISMQLVKNVFLNRNKTVARKLEEALIVWIIESKRLTSKERMFEVYLNIAEWGPGVYGAEEAARFYFDKSAANLTPSEAIFMAGIIPRPKAALYSFDENMQLKPYHEGYYKLLTERLLIKGTVSESEAATIKPEVELKGAAKEIFLKKAMIAENADSVLSELPELTF